ncbi:MAG: hypothetical protein LBI64_01690 [Coriobacteriales bacterium]|jgi:hypothetical protein|nr:hypothetical protein [Coriobacteriales bacterium]
MMTADDIRQSGETEISSEQAADQMLLYAFDQAVEMLEAGEGFDPFTILLKDDEFFIEDHPEDTIEECTASARNTIRQMALVASDYVFVYDGYVELDEGPSDAIIVERAHAGDEEGEVFAMLYEEHGDHLHFDETLYGIGNAPNYFAETDDSRDGDA